MILLRIPKFTLNTKYLMNSRSYIRMHSDSESAQIATMVGNCLFFKHYPTFGEAVYRIYRQSVHCTNPQYYSDLYKNPVPKLYRKPVLYKSTASSKLSTAYPPQKRSPTKSAASVDNLVQLKFASRKTSKINLNNSYAKITRDWHLELC